MVNRKITLSNKRSFFLFGARGTGKTTLLKNHFVKTEALWLDLLDPELEGRLQQHPNLLVEFTQKLPPKSWVIIDEIQKIPALLSVVHQLIREKKLNFALTGSSARKLKRQGADLLAGRASWFDLFPFMYEELNEFFHLENTLRFGSLPETLELDVVEKIRYLKSYCSTYLKEEVIAEQLIRKVQPFRNFLNLAAAQNGQIINYANFAKDVSVEIPTIQTYFEILVDTLLGFELLPFQESVRKRQRKNPKFYFFDLGITRALAGEVESIIIESSSAYGKAFEHFVILEVYRKIKTHEKEWNLSYLRTKDDAEIDLIIEKSKKDRWAIEIKSSDRVDLKEVRKLEELGKDILNSKLFYVSRDPIERKIGLVECIHWKTLISKLFE